MVLTDRIKKINNGYLITFGMCVVVYAYAYCTPIHQKVDAKKKR